MYQVKSGNSQREISWQNEDVLTAIIDGKKAEVDVLHLQDGHYHFLFNNQSYNVELVSIEKESKTVNLKVNGSSFTFQLKDRLDELLDKLGLSAVTKSKVSELKAPMPGLVIEIRVQPGQSISKGDPVLLLEAMKMENIIKSPVDAVIKKIHFVKGEAVEKGAVLVSFE